jgi:hypothetical protein
MTTNAIPESHGALISLATLALAGAQSLGQQIDLRQCTAAAIAVDLYAVTGEPGNDTPSSGAQGVLNRARADSVQARAAYRDEVAAGCDFCARAVGLLKNMLGRQWNARWAEAGFSDGSLRIPRKPLAKLTQLRAYFRAHPEHENAPLDVSAARADALIASIAAAEYAAEAGKAQRVGSKQVRDAAIKQLRRRMSALRNEITLLLKPSDPRWYEFGFRRPDDGRIPAKVSGLLVTPGLPSEVIVQWERASLAENYRVTWKLKDAESEPPPQPSPWRGHRDQRQRAEFLR